MNAKPKKNLDDYDLMELLKLLKKEKKRNKSLKERDKLRRDIYELQHKNELLLQQLNSDQKQMGSSILTERHIELKELKELFKASSELNQNLTKAIEFKNDSIEQIKNINKKAAILLENAYENQIINHGEHSQLQDSLLKDLDLSEIPLDTLADAIQETKDQYDMIAKKVEIIKTIKEKISPFIILPEKLRNLGHNNLSNDTIVNSLIKEDNMDNLDDYLLAADHEVEKLEVRLKILEQIADNHKKASEKLDGIVAMSLSYNKELGEKLIAEDTIEKLKEHLADVEIEEPKRLAKRIEIIKQIKINHNLALQKLNNRHSEQLPYNQQLEELVLTESKLERLEQHLKDAIEIEPLRLELKSKIIDQLNYNYKLASEELSVSQRKPLYNLKLEEAALKSRDFNELNEILKKANEEHSILACQIEIIRQRKINDELKIKFGTSITSTSPTQVLEKTGLEALNKLLDESKKEYDILKCIDNIMEQRYKTDQFVEELHLDESNLSKHDLNHHLKFLLEITDLARLEKILSNEKEKYENLKLKNKLNKQLKINNEYKDELMEFTISEKKPKGYFDKDQNYSKPVLLKKLEEVEQSTQKIEDKINKFFEALGILKESKNIFNQQNLTDINRDIAKINELIKPPYNRGNIESLKSIVRTMYEKMQPLHIHKSNRYFTHERDENLEQTVKKFEVNQNISHCIKIRDQVVQKIKIILTNKFLTLELVKQLEKYQNYQKQINLHLNNVNSLVTQDLNSTNVQDELSKLFEETKECDRFMSEPTNANLSANLFKTKLLNFIEDNVDLFKLDARNGTETKINNRIYQLPKTMSNLYRYLLEVNIDNTSIVGLVNDIKTRFFGRGHSNFFSTFKRNDNAKDFYVILKNSFESTNLTKDPDKYIGELNNKLKELKNKITIKKDTSSFNFSTESNDEYGETIITRKQEPSKTSASNNDVSGNESVNIVNPPGGTQNRF